jgi:hypothetical protein
MADGLEYADLTPIDDTSYQNLWTVTSRRNQTYGLGDVYTQVFAPAEVEVRNYVNQNPRYDFSNPEDFDAWYSEEAPQWHQFSSLPAGDTFEGYVANTARVYANDYPTFYQAINQGIDSGKFGLDPANKTSYRAFATGIFNEYKDATEKAFKYQQDWWAQSSLGKKGIPSPELNYDPKKFANYQKWSSGIKEAIKTYYPEEFAKYGKEIDQAIEARAISLAAANKRTPFHDALLKQEAYR